MYNYLKLFMLLTLVTAYSCDPDDPDPVNEEELITTVIYTLTPQGGGTPVVLSFKDTDGSGGNAPIITGGILSNNTTYTGALQFLNESSSSPKNITTEISSEGADHQVFISATTQALADAIEFSYVDFDSNGKPIGTKIDINTINTATGEMIITLKHKPNKSATNVSNGDITNAGGETDVEVSFPIEIK